MFFYCARASNVGADLMQQQRGRAGDSLESDLRQLRSSPSAGPAAGGRGSRWGKAAGVLLAASGVVAVVVCMASVASLRGDVKGFQAEVAAVEKSPTGGGHPAADGHDLVYCTVRGDDACFGKQIEGTGGSTTKPAAPPAPPTPFSRCGSDGSCSKGICDRNAGLCSACWHDGDCSVGFYCNHGDYYGWDPTIRGFCEQCEGLRSGPFDDSSAICGDPTSNHRPGAKLDCCDEAFLRQCPSDPGQCKGCTTIGNCPASTFCTTLRKPGLNTTANRCISCSAVVEQESFGPEVTCSPAFLKICPKDPALCVPQGRLKCTSHADCPKGVGTNSQDSNFFTGSYCANGQCAYCGHDADSETLCDGIGGDCCSAEFQAQCPTDPFHCKACKSHADCPKVHAQPPDGSSSSQWSEYCAKGGNCASCGSNITALVCDAFDDQCCTQAFIERCNGVLDDNGQPLSDLHKCGSSSGDPSPVFGSFEWKLSWAIKRGCTDAGSAAYAETSTCNGGKNVGGTLGPGYMDQAATMRTRLLVLPALLY